MNFFSINEFEKTQREALILQTSTRYQIQEYAPSSSVGQTDTFPTKHLPTVAHKPNAQYSMASLSGLRLFIILGLMMGLSLLWISSVQATPNVDPPFYTPTPTVTLTATPTQAATGDMRPEEIAYLLITEPNQNSQHIKRAIQKAGGTIIRHISEINTLVVSATNPDFATQAMTIPGVQAMIPDLTVQLIEPPTRVMGPASLDAQPGEEDDPFFALQWSHKVFDTATLWAAGFRGAGVRVAILDNGVDADHPDIVPNLNRVLSQSFVPGESFDIQPGLYFHQGTHVAGIIAAADNGIGTIGLAPEAELIAIKVVSEHTGSGKLSGLLAGIIYAAKIETDIIHLSQTSLTIQDEDKATYYTALNRAIAYAQQQGATLVRAANDFSPQTVSGSIVGPPNTETQGELDFTTLIGHINPDLFLSGELCTLNTPYPCWVFDLVVGPTSEGWAWTLGTNTALPQISGITALRLSQSADDLRPAQIQNDLLGSPDSFAE